MTETRPDVAVLLCTFNGGEFLSAQLRSLRRQSGVTLTVYASDDGSTDNTLAILESARQHWGSEALQVRRGPGSGAAQNFLALVCDEQIDADYYCYADQDDVWDDDKLVHAVAALANCEPVTAALYCGRTRSLSDSGRPVGLSPHFSKAPSFANALVQNIAGGNTMVMNRAARALLLDAGVMPVVSHDWWTYLLITGAGGTVIYDPQPRLGYRQHAGNLVGANTGWRRRVRRYLAALSGRNRAWNAQNIACLEACDALLVAENRELLQTLKWFRDRGLLERLGGLRKSGLYAQTRWGNLGLLGATILKKI